MNNISTKKIQTFVTSLLESELQDMMVVIASSSNFLQVEKADLQLLRPAAMALDSFEALHILAASTISVRLELVQQEQAMAGSTLDPPIDFERQSLAPAWNLAASSEHIEM